MINIIRNWKFGLLLLLLFIFTIVYPVPETGNMLTWIGFILIVSVCGLIYEIAKWLERRKKNPAK